MPADRMTPKELRDRLDGPSPPLVVDVREAWEVEIAALPGALWIPLDELAARAEEVPFDRDIVVACHHGVRSAFAARFLAEAGRERVFNLVGGVDGWARDVDPDFPTY